MLPGFISRCTIPFSRKCFIPAAETEKKVKHLKIKSSQYSKIIHTHHLNIFVVLNPSKFFKLFTTFD